MGVILSGELSGLLAEAGGRWPEADEDRLHELSGSWRTLAQNLRSTANDGTVIAGRVASDNTGSAVDAFSGYWTEDRSGLRQREPDGAPRDPGGDPMTGEVQPVQDRAIPRFVAEWRAGFVGEGAEDFTPLDYLSANQGLPFTIAAQWLFCPDFVEYRGCVVVVKESDDEGNMTDANKVNVDHWYDYFHGDISRTESMANLLHIGGLFASADEDPYEQYLPALARSVARCWEGLLAVRFPDRRFTMEVYGDSASELDPNITFYTSTP